MDFKIVIPVIISFVISVILAPVIIPFLRRLKASQTERTDGVKSHLSKAGTPTMGGLIFMNGVLQLIITPLLNRYMGAKQLGELLYITGLVAIICPSIGQALNTSRLVVRRSHEVTNGDYDWILLLFGVLGSSVALFMSRDSIRGIPVGIGVFALFMVTVFRYYGDVEYRLTLNYQRYFIYYFLFCSKNSVSTKLAKLVIQKIGKILFSRKTKY